MTIDDDIKDIVNRQWEKTETPIEKLFGDSGLEEKPDGIHYTLKSKVDIFWNGSMILVGQEFPCHLCGETNKWVLDRIDIVNGSQVPIVFVCEHEPIVIIGRGAIRQISSVPTKYISSIIEEKS